MRTRTLAPDDPNALEDFCADVASRPLRRDTPMWELWLVDGLAGGGQALVAKIHHSLTDGVGSLELVCQLFDERPAQYLDSLREAPVPIREEPVPSWAWLLGRASCSMARFPAVLAQTWLELVRSTLRVYETVEDLAGAELAAPLATPRLPFHGPISGRRAVALEHLPLERVEAIADASGTHVNDVVLAVLAGTLRRWLDKRGELPTRPLVAAVPVSTRFDEDVFEPGNHVSACFVHLPTDRPDPRERLAVTAAVASSGKAIHAAVGASTLEHLTSLTFPMVLSMPSNLYQQSGAAAHHPAPVNLVVSNVSGPHHELYLAGRRATAFHTLGPIFDGVSLNVTALSYAGVLSLGFLTCPDRIDDLEGLADGQVDALEELAEAYEV